VTRPEIQLLGNFLATSGSLLAITLRRGPDTTVYKLSKYSAERVNVSDDATTTVESTDFAADTSQEEVSAEVSFRQPVEGTADGAQADTLTPYSARMPEYEEEL